jgi:uncharacterized membrane protein
MAGVLRVGLVLAVVLLAAALVTLVARSPLASSGAYISANPLSRYLDLRTLAAGLASGTPEAFLTLGAYVLIATPVARVVSGTYAFAAVGERRLAAITGAVLALLLLGLLVVGPLVR